MNRSDLRLYAVSACNAPVSDLIEAQEGGATFLQLREKNLSGDEFLEKAKAIRQFASVPFVINDNVDIAVASHADGVHVGQGDAPLAEARARLGSGKIVGVSCSTVAEAVAAEKGGADYLGVGAVFPTGTKADAVDVPPSVLRAITASVRIPVVAIGGIHAGNILQLGGSGIDGVAVVSALFGSGNVRERTRAFAEKVRSMLAVPVQRPQALLLDLDGLLLDSCGVWNQVDIQFLKNHDLYTPDNLERLHKCGTISEAAAMLRRYGSTLSDEQVQVEVEHLLYDAYRNDLQFFPGVDEFLETMRKAGKKLALFTASPESLVRPALKRLGALDCFDEIFCEVDKTTPAAFYHALEVLGTGIADTMLYDDRPEPRQMAELLGFPTAGHI